MRKLRPRSIHPLPDLYWITSEQLRLALGRSLYLWRKIDLPVLGEYFPPAALGPDPIGDRRWRIDDITERYPALVSHLTPNTSWLERFKKRQRETSDAYIAQREAERSVRAAAA